MMSCRHRHPDSAPPPEQPHFFAAGAATTKAWHAAPSPPARPEKAATGDHRGTVSASGPSRGVDGPAVCWADSPWVSWGIPGGCDRLPVVRVRRDTRNNPAIRAVSVSGPCGTNILARNWVVGHVGCLIFQRGREHLQAARCIGTSTRFGSRQWFVWARKILPDVGGSLYVRWKLQISCDGRYWVYFSCICDAWHQSPLVPVRTRKNKESWWLTISLLWSWTSKRAETHQGQQRHCSNSGTCGKAGCHDMPLRWAKAAKAVQSLSKQPLLLRGIPSKARRKDSPSILTFRHLGFVSPRKTAITTCESNWTLLLLSAVVLRDSILARRQWLAEQLPALK